VRKFELSIRKNQQMKLFLERLKEPFLDLALLGDFSDFEDFF